MLILWDDESEGGTGTGVLETGVTDDGETNEEVKPEMVDSNAESVLESGEKKEETPKEESTTFESKPDWLPEKHWDSTNNTMRTESFLKSSIDTQKELHRMQQGKGPGVPDKVEDYLKGDAFNEKGFVFPEDTGLDPLAADDPILASFAAIAHAEGIAVDKFNRIIAKVYPEMANQNAPSFNVEEELTKLGRGDLKDGQRRASTVAEWIGALASRNAITAEQSTMMMTGWGSTAAGADLLMQIRNMTGEKEIPMGAPMESEGFKSMPQIRDMMKDKRYGKDEGFTKEVSEELLRIQPPNPEDEGPEFT